MIRRPPRSTRTYTRFPYTTLFRSDRLLKPRELTLVLTGSLDQRIDEFVGGGEAVRAGAKFGPVLEVFANRDGHPGHSDNIGCRTSSVTRGACLTPPGSRPDRRPRPDRRGSKYRRGWRYRPQLGRSTRLNSSHSCTSRMPSYD